MPVTQLMTVLADLRRRAKLASVLFGIGLIVAAAAGGLLLIVLIDYLLHLPGLARLAFLLAALGGLGWLLWRHVVRPVVTTLTLDDVAGRVERVYPQFDDRLRSAVQFQRDEDATGGDPRQRRNVVRQAGEIAANLDLRRVVRFAPAGFSLGGAAVAATALVLLAVIVGHDTRSVIAGRLLSPFDGPEWPTRQELEVVGDVPAKLPAGRKFDVRVRLARGDEPDLRPVLRYTTPAGNERQVLMQRADDGAFVAPLDVRLDGGRADGELKITVEAGDDTLDFDPIAVVPRLEVEAVEAAITPPEYVHDARPRVADLTRGGTVAVEGAAVTLTTRFNKPLATGGEAIRLVAANDAALPELDWQIDGATATATWAARETARFRVEALDRDGFTNAALGEYEVAVRPDREPSVVLEQPARNERRTADATVPLIGVAGDDFGLAFVELVVREVAEDGQRVDGPAVRRRAAAADGRLVAGRAGRRGEPAAPGDVPVGAERARRGRAAAGRHLGVLPPGRRPLRVRGRDPRAGRERAAADHDPVAGRSGRRGAGRAAAGQGPGRGRPQPPAADPPGDQPT